MTNLLNELITFMMPIAPWLELLQITTMLLCLFALSQTLRARSASVRHVLWAAGLVAVLALPLLSTQLPWHARVLPPIGTATIADREAAPVMPPSPVADSAKLSRTQNAVAVEAEKPDRRTSGASTTAPAGDTPVPVLRDVVQMRTIVIALWAMGALFFVLRFLMGVATLSWFARRSEPAALDQRFTAVADEVGVRRPVRMLLSPVLGMPMTWGILRPLVLLPADAPSWEPERLRATLLHELAHVRRRDTLWQTLSQLVCAVYWFHPLVWKAARQLELESEQACDAMVTNRGISPKHYARHLIEIARQRHVETAPAALMPMARRSQLRRRLETVLGHGRGAAKASPRSAAWVMMLVAMTATSVAALQTAPERPAERRPDGAIEGGTISSVGDDVAPPPMLAQSPKIQQVDASQPVANDPAVDAQLPKIQQVDALQPVSDDPVVDARPADTRHDIDGVALSMARTVKTEKWEDRDWGGSNHGRYARGMFQKRLSTFVLTDNDYTMAKWDDGRSTYSVESEGSVRLGADDRTIASLSRDGMFVVQEIRGNDRRRYEVYDDGGEIREVVYESKHADRLGGIDDWLGAVLLATARRTGLDASGRVDRIMASRGVGGVFDEIERIDSDGVSRVYFRLLFDTGKLDRAQVRAAVAKIAQTIDSDGDKAGLLVGVADYFIDDPDLTNDFFEASKTISSDGDKRQVILAVFDREALPQKSALIALNAIGDVSSDGDQSYLLMEAAERFRIEGEVADAFFNVMKSISSDGDKAQVLLRLIDSRSLDTAAQNMTLRGAALVSSDGDAARVLIRFVGRYPVDGDNADAFFQAAHRISSDGDMTRVLVRLGDQGKMSDDVKHRLLEAMRDISSDGDKAELMVSVAPHYRDNEELRKAYLEVAETISSDGDYRRVVRLFAADGSRSR